MFDVIRNKGKVKRGFMLGVICKGV